MFKMAERSDGCSGEILLAPYTRKKRLQRKITKATTGWVFKKISACSVSHRENMIIIASFSCLYLKDQLGLCSSNCHTYAMTGSCSASQRVLANSLRVVSAKRGNPPLDKS